MAKAIFHKRFPFTSKKANAGWDIHPSEEPQHFPEEVIAAAVEKGCATRVPPKRSFESTAQNADETAADTPAAD